MVDGRLYLLKSAKPHLLVLLCFSQGFPVSGSFLPVNFQFKTTTLAVRQQSFAQTKRVSAGTN